MKALFWLLILILLIFHQDYWQWDRSDLVFGFVPYSLAYHMGLSIVTALFWLAAVNLFWPKHSNDIITQSETGADA